MIDIEKIRRNPEKFREAIKNKRVPLDLDELLQIDQERRRLTDLVNRLRQERNRLSQLVAHGAAPRDENIAAARQLGEQLSADETALAEVEQRCAQLMAS